MKVPDQSDRNSWLISDPPKWYKMPTSVVFWTILARLRPIPGRPLQER